MTTKTVLITGSSSGFGKLLVDTYLREGHQVIATMRNVEQRKELFPELYNLHLVELDITNKQQRDQLKTMINQKFAGKIDILINNAGYGAYGALEDASDEFLFDQMNTNFLGTAALTRDLLPFLRLAQGKIFFISSIMGLVSMPMSSIYSASKFAIEGLVAGLRYETSRFGVQVTSICPGRHRTDFAKNMKWTIQETQSSVYHSYYQGVKRMMHQLSTGKAVPAQQVIDAILKAQDQKTLPPRIIVGKDAKSLAMLSKILPINLYYLLTQRLFNKKLLS
jgi:short-subunit dehydrogenase